MKKIVLAGLMLTAALLAQTKTKTQIQSAAARNWQQGIVRETAFQVQDLGAAAQAMTFPGWGPYAPSMGMATAGQITRTWEGFRIEAVDAEYMVACPVRPRRMPNVAVNGAVRFAFDKGRFYVLDDDNRQFEMMVLQKRRR